MTTRLEQMMAYRHSLVLSVAWRLVTELYRRHSADHDLRLLRTHPGISQLGQLRLLVNPRVGHVTTCTQLVLNLGGPTGTYEVWVGGNQTASGGFLIPALSGQLTAVLDQVEEAMGVRAPSKLPSSTRPVLTMRLVAEVLTASWLDRQEYGLETAWFDWSGGVRVQPWAAHFDVDVSGLQTGLEAGRLDWQSVYLQVSGLFRLGGLKNGAIGMSGWAVDMASAAFLYLDGAEVRHTLDIYEGYIKHGKQLEPLAARLLTTMRRQQYASSNGE